LGKVKCKPPKIQDLTSNVLILLIIIVIVPVLVLVVVVAMYVDAVLYLLIPLTYNVYVTVIRLQKAWMHELVATLCTEM
jgi:hypothetical protein